MRTLNSIRNIFWSLFSQITILILGFISRKVVLDSLGVSYLGLNGLLSNIFSILSLVEGGLGISIVYNLYKPLAEDNKEEVKCLINFYKKTYIVLAILIFILSICIYPLVFTTVSVDSSVHDVSIVYILYVLKLILTYLYAHKWSLINADQKGYVLKKMTLFFQIITMIGKIIVLYLTKNYIYFLILELVVQVIQNIVNGRIVDRLYPYISVKKNEVIKPLSLSVKNNIIKNVKALFLHNIGSAMINGTDNILITKYVSLAYTGIYSNYILIVSSVAGLISPFIGGLGASIGNLIASESEKKVYNVFKVTYFINFVLYSCAVTVLFNTTTPFISLYFGKEYILDKTTLGVILLNFYLGGMTSSIFQFKSKAGIFSQDKYAPIIQSIINLAASIYFGSKYGIIGIIAGTIISTLCVIFITQPYFTYKFVFHEKVINYYIQYLKYILLTIIMVISSSTVCSHLISNTGLISILLKGITSLLISIIIILGVFWRSKEIGYLLALTKKFKRSLKKID